MGYASRLDDHLSIEHSKSRQIERERDRERQRERQERGGTVLGIWDPFPVTNLCFQGYEELSPLPLDLQYLFTCLAGDIPTC